MCLWEWRLQGASITGEGPQGTAQHPGIPLMPVSERASPGTPNRGRTVRALWGIGLGVGLFPSPQPSSTLGPTVASSARCRPTPLASLASVSELNARTGPHVWSGVPVPCASACLALVAPNVRSC